MGIPFRKVQGLGNDFVVVHESDLSGITMDSQRAQAWCDRHFGVGADGVLVLSPSDVADARLRVLNADGSEPEMCGNGLRAAVVELARCDGWKRGGYRVETGAGVLSCKVRPPKGGLDPTVEVEMGTVLFGSGSPRTLQVDDHEVEVFEASIGNPHAVVFVDDGQDLAALAKDFGGRLSVHSAFAGGANIEFARVSEGGGLDLVVYERGAGMTLACGTGACAATAVAQMQGRLDASAGVAVSLPGGTLHVWVAPGGGGPSSGPVTMVGPARPVFEGQIFEGWGIDD